MSMKEHSYELKIYNGRVKVYVDGYVMFSFSQLDFVGYYNFINETNVYGIEIYLLKAQAGFGTMKIFFEEKSIWLSVINLLDTHL